MSARFPDSREAGGPATLAELLAEYLRLTGRPPQPARPRTAFGLPLPSVPVLPAAAGEHHPLNGEALDLLEGVAADLRRLDDKLDTPTMDRWVHWHLRLLAEYQQELQALPRLAATIGDVMQLAGTLDDDMLEQDAAWRHWRIAATAAYTADDHQLLVFVLAGMTRALAEQGATGHALRYLGRATTAAGLGVSARLDAYLATVEAEVHARRGDVLGCGEALWRATRLMLAATEAGEGAPTYLCSFGTAAVAARGGACHLRLGQPDLARAALEIALHQLTASSTRERALAATDLAVAVTRQGDGEQGARLARSALTAATEAGSLRAILRVRELRLELGPWGASSAVSELDEQLHLVELLG